ncbi:Similar to S.cerevisiae protein SDA1 (Protein required for actin organization and passage through Start) [Malassezia sympodialis ATCC 42132]|uniref:Protein SDA1 n=1 Tax=Malassezia sympodialis (strain ATCC 42132) TaxID=1230383 RepID=A0A1M8A8A3_MALS4|nr:Similar to S.cerevisiae protein SDA1 (Protein required for actin organization and passage through Start) [Malassezia sympodialis ATCC 42132]
MGKTAGPARPSAVVRDQGLVYRSKARGLQDTSNLPALQNLLKRQPSAYTEEFLAQWNHYESLRRIYASGLGQSVEGADVSGVQSVRMSKDQQAQLEQLVSFVTQLAPSYPAVTKELPSHLSELLLEHHASLSPDLRRTCLRCLVMLRHRQVITSETLLRTLFPLLSRTTSSEMRTTILNAIVHDLKQANHKTKDPRLNRMVQGLLFGMVERGLPADGAGATVLRRADAELKGRTEALWAVRVAAEMWRRRIWTDDRTVALLAMACTHPHPKVQASAVRFFLGDLHASEAGADESDDESNPRAELGRLEHQRKVGKKSKAGERKLKLAKAHAQRRRKEQDEKALERADQDSGNMAAIHLLHDPQSFAERVFENLTRNDKRHSLEMKVRLLQLLSRVMSAHRLAVLSFYSYLAKYLVPHQMHITLILVALAQSVHDQTPPDVLTPALRKIAYAFVHPGVGAEVVAAGINTIREVCRRQPWCMEEDLLEDLVAYRRSKDKGVSAASRGLMQLYREVNPAMLRRAERGKSGAMALAHGHAAERYGTDRREVHGIQGIELLEQHLREHGDDEGDDDEGWDGWELESASDSDSSGWINVSSDDDEGHIELDSSDDEAPPRADKAADERPMSERVRESRRQRRAARQARAEAPASDEDGEAPPAPAPTEAPDTFSELATTKILTPADFAKLNELRLAAAEEKAKEGGAAGAQARRELAALQLQKKRTSGTGEVVDESDILGPRKKAKADYEERMASIQSGREGRDKFGSRKGKKNKEVASSSTNRQKARGKNFQMVAHSWGVRSKKKASLREKSKRLRKHVTQAKKRLK